MGQDTREIEQEIRDRRAELGRNLGELQDKARDLADWRTHYRSHSMAFLGAAFGAGVLLAIGTTPRSRVPESRTATDHSHDPYPRLPARWASRSDTVARAQRHFGETWDQIADGLLRLASLKAIQVVSRAIPGFRDQLDTPSGPASHTLH